MKVITLLNEKGGVGKTTLATHIAAGLAIRGKRVVLADADPQGQAGKLLGMRKEPGFYNVLIREEEFKTELRAVNPEVYSAGKPAGELYLLPGNLETRVISQINPDPFIIRNRFEDLVGWADVVVFDTSPSPSMIHTAIYMATGFVLLPTTPAFLGLDGIAHSIAHQENASTLRQQNNLGEVRRMGVIPTMFKTNTVAHDVALQQLAKSFGRNLWPPMPERQLFQKAAMAGQLLYKFAPNSATTVEILGALIQRVEKGLNNDVFA